MSSEDQKKNPSATPISGSAATRGGHSNSSPSSSQQLSPQAQQQQQQHENATPFPLKAVYGVPLDVTIVLGQRKMNIAQVLELKPNAVIELDRKENEPVEIHINGKCVAHGEIVVVGDKIGVTIMSIIDPDRAW